MNCPSSKHRHYNIYIYTLIVFYGTSLLEDQLKLVILVGEFKILNGVSEEKCSPRGALLIFFLEEKSGRVSINGESRLLLDIYTHR